MKQDQQQEQAPARTQRPLSKSFQKKALAYIEKCEKRPNASAFQNFEQKIFDFVQGYGTRKQAFTFTFEEYVIWEVRSKIYYDIVSKRGLYHRFEDWIYLNLIRRECKQVWGVTSRYHTKMYRDLIDKAFFEAGMNTIAVRLHWGTPEERKYRESNNMMLEPKNDRVMEHITRSMRLRAKVRGS